MEGLDPTLREAIERKRLIFTVTTGRSGTNYLADLLRRVDGVTARHEPESRFSALMRLVQDDPELATRFWRKIKLPEIADIGSETYAETSHLFCKGFFEPLVELGIVPDLVFLTRDKRKVARSIFVLGEIPGRSKWYLSPDDPGVLPLPNWRDLHDYQLCYWYTLEIERRGKKYGEMLRPLGGRFVEIDLEELVTRPGQDRLFEELDLPDIPLKRRVKMALTSRVVNRKSRRKKVVNRVSLLDSVDLDELEAAVADGVSTQVIESGD